MTRNVLNMRVHGNASPSLTLTDSTLAANGKACGAMSCAGSGTKTTTPTVAGVYIGMDNAATGGIEICASNTQSIDFTIMNSEYRGKMSYVNIDSSFNWYVRANAGPTPTMKLTPSGLSVSGAALATGTQVETQR